jgi:hypothetical protein
VEVEEVITLLVVVVLEVLGFSLPQGLILELAIQ